MWANVIVMKAKFLYRLVQGGVGVDLNMPNRAFKGAEKPLNPAVLPRAVRVASLMANAERCHTCLKFVADKCAVVVGAQGLGFAKVGDQIPEQYQHGRGAFVRKSQRQIFPAANADYLYGQKLRQSRTANCKSLCPLFDSAPGH